jgi:heme/copper-type cytochrome/quinol oxidase subunit 2
MLLAQIAVQTDRHPYHTQLISFFVALAPIAIIVALLIFVQIWRIRRNRKKSRHPVR